jgi:hypothetical protein
MTTATTDIIVAPVKTTCADHALQEAQGILDHARAIVIKDQVGYEEAAIALKQLKARAAALEEERTKITKPMDAAKKAVMDLFRKPAEFLGEAERIVKASMVTYSNEQERIRKAEQARLDEIARKEREKIAAQAAKAEAAGKTEKAEALQEKAQNIAAPVVESTVEKTSGISYRTVYEFEIVDAEAIPREWMIPDLKAIGGAVRSTQGKINIPGIKAVARKTIAA